MKPINIVSCWMQISNFLIVMFSNLEEEKLEVEEKKETEAQSCFDRI